MFVILISASTYVSAKSLIIENNEMFRKVKIISKVTEEVYKIIYPNNKVSVETASMINYNNLKIKKLKEERDYLFVNIREQLKNNILKNNSPN